jgi:hypothetical protein
MAVHGSSRQLDAWNGDALLEYPDGDQWDFSNRDGVILRVGETFPGKSLVIDRIETRPGAEVEGRSLVFIVLLNP